MSDFDQIPLEAPAQEEVIPQPQPDWDIILRTLANNQNNLQDSLRDMADGLSQLTIQMQEFTRSKVTTSAFQKPSAFEGNRGADARRFLAAFSNYAMGTGPQLNNANPTGGFHRNDAAWIQASLSHLTKEAAIWATPYMEELAVGRHPFDSDWDKFVAAFKLRFETADEAVEAKEALRTLYQGSKTVPEYTARFQEVAPRTGYSEADLRDRFYEHLATKVKDELVHTERPTKSLSELIKVASDVDTRIRQRATEKARELGKAPPASSNRTFTFSAPAPTAPSRDPNAMDVDAAKMGNGKTRFDYLRWMTGKCFGCGATDHTKAQGNHSREICGHCHRLGHKEEVCQDKFMGIRPRSQRAAASTVEASSTETLSASSAPSADHVAAIEKLMVQQEELSRQLDMLKSVF